MHETSRQVERIKACFNIKKLNRKNRQATKGNPETIARQIIGGNYTPGKITLGARQKSRQSNTETREQQQNTKGVSPVLKLHPRFLLLLSFHCVLVCPTEEAWERRKEIMV